MNPDPDSVSSESARLQARIAAHRGGRRRYALAAVLLLAALAIGAVIGAGATVIYMKGKRPRPPSPDQVGATILEDMTKVLPLDGKEKDELRRVVVGRMGKVADIRRKSWDDIRDQFDAMQDEVVDILGPDRYEKWEADRDKRLGEKKNLRSGRGYDRHRWRERYNERHHGGGLH